jgi:DNA-directed RNA polymerase subunit RPC12/RpoP
MRDIGRSPGEPPDEREVEWRDDDEGHCASCGLDVTNTLALNIMEWLQELSAQDFNDECPHCGSEIVVQFTITVEVTGYETKLYIQPEDPNDAHDYLADR